MSTVAWVASNPDEGHSCVVYADTRGQARRAGLGELSENDSCLEFTGVRVRRAKEWDGEKAPTRRQLFDAGWWFMCSGCERPCSNEDEPAPVWREDHCVDCASCAKAVKP